MKSQCEVSIRPMCLEDLDKLIVFFKKAYGQNTVFQDKDFLKYYFVSRHIGKADDTACLVAHDLEGGEIISHYGGLFYKLNLNNKVVPLVWGVNAYTLPEWRGKGINSKIVEYIHNSNIINAVIGMPFEGPSFYKKFGYNIFNKETFTRYVYLLDSKTFDVIGLMQQDVDHAKQILKVNMNRNFIFDCKKIIKITKDNLDSYTLDFDITNITTTHRDHDFIKWRLLENPYIDYEIFAYVTTGKIKSYLVIREETLEPQKFKVSRIIDLFGSHDHMADLINYCKKHALQNSCIYIDFSAYGRLYENELLNSDFIKLENEDYSILPQVTAPIENRPNHEFIVIQSKMYSDNIAKLNKENTYFSRIDADRDRIAKVSQINRQVLQK